MTEHDLLDVAIKEARKGLTEGGVPIGSAIMDAQGHIVGKGHNLIFQTKDPTAHAEMCAARTAGIRNDWQSFTLATTLSPCLMCSGLITFYQIPRIIIGDDTTVPGARNTLSRHQISFEILNDPSCIDMLQTWIDENPKKWAVIEGHEHPNN
ncbi:tRNA-specific adenosine deaminase [Poriferisphaera corsica]|uniref:tRNA-specific adenosine deaminase n=1 Tax=Poriferisphaera corsica TaxID=2528020 RepID=A0A517YQJ2_9BACT|nr:nucleoside deaminase [Poriferisphaera corsica]QDU32484.1 tRNA-specific adenosine deaminase [Poriferisphaera corsica]